VSQVTSALLAGQLAPVARPAPAGEPTGPYTPAPAPAAVFGESPDADTPPAAGRVSSTADSAKNPGYFRTVARLGIQAAEALEHAHQLGVIHRDVKPANLLVETSSPLAPPGERGRG
jgi:hypothetical protein